MTEKFNQASTLISLDESTRSKRRVWKWTKTNVARANDVLAVCDELHGYKPITERQLYYRLISSRMISQSHWNKYNRKDGDRVDVYGTIGPLLKWMRIDGKLHWDDISDETRVLTYKRGSESPEQFIRQDMDNFLRGYSRCVAQDQENFIEIWIEKQALLNIVEPVAEEFCRRVLCCKGYNSVSFQAGFYRRARAAMNAGQKAIVLYFGDYDPSGVNMLHAAMQTLHDELGLSGVEFHRCGINPCHFSQLEADPVPLKPDDSRAKAFIEKYGETCFELDAIHPHDLEKLVRESIIQFTDMEAVSCNYEIQKRDLAFIADIRKDLINYVDQKFTV
jgi:hypothetical protein